MRAGIGAAPFRPPGRPPSGCNFRVGAVAVHDPGTEYNIGDVLSVVSGDWIRQARIRVDTITLEGGVGNATILYVGCYRTVDANPQHTTVTDSNGTECTLDITWWQPHA